MLFVIGCFLVSNVYAQTTNIIKTSYFSIEPLDNWTHEVSGDKTITQSMGNDASNSIILYPNEINIGTAVEAGNAVIVNFEQDNTFNDKNAPLSEFVKFKTENAAAIISQEDTTVDGEPAVKVLSNVKGDQGVTKYLFIYTKHDTKFYTIGFISYSNNFTNIYQNLNKCLIPLGLLNLQQLPIL